MVEIIRDDVGKRKVRRKTDFSIKKQPEPITTDIAASIDVCFEEMAIAHIQS